MGEVVSNINNFTSLTCKATLDCSSCLNYSFCVFIIFLSGSSICASVSEIQEWNEKDDEDDSSNILKILTEQNECLPHSEKENEGNFNDTLKMTTRIRSVQLILTKSQRNLVSLDSHTFELKRHYHFEEIKKINLMHYNTNARPPNSSKKVEVNSLMLFVKSIDLDESESMFSVNAELVIKWEDRRLGWPENITIAGALPNNELHFDLHEIWHPKLMLDDPTNANETIPDSVVACVDFRGIVTLKQNITLGSVCQINLLRWPYDSHQCNVSFVLDYIEQVGHVSLEKFVGNPGWNLTGIELNGSIFTYEKSSESYAEAIVVFTVARNCFFFEVLCFFIFVCTSLMTMSVILPKPFTEYQIILPIFSFFFMFMMVSTTAMFSPFLLTEITVLALVYFLNTTMIVCSLILSFCIHKFSDRRPPFWLQILLCIPILVLDEDEEEEMGAIGLQNLAKKEWTFIASAINVRLIILHIIYTMHIFAYCYGHRENHL